MDDNNHSLNHSQNFFLHFFFSVFLGGNVLNCEQVCQCRRPQACQRCGLFVAIWDQAVFTRRPLLLSRSLPLPLLPLPSVNIAMHASPTVLAALHPPPTSLHPPTCLHHLFWLASILPSSPLPDLPVFCPLSSLPPALSVLVQPCPLFPQRLPFPLCRCPLTPLSSPPQSPSPSPADRGLVGTPKSSCSSLDCCPPSVPSFKVFFSPFPFWGG